MKKLIIIGLIFFYNISFCQHKFFFESDFACFNYDERSCILEIYYNFHPNQFNIIQEEDEKVIKGLIKVRIQRYKSSEILVNKEWSFGGTIDSNYDGVKKNFVGIMAFQLLFDDYICVLNGMDATDSNKVDSIKYIIEIKKKPEEQFSISDIQIASSIIQTEERNNSIFYKNTYEVIPNPSLIFGAEIPVLYFYTELYNVNNNIECEYLKVEHILKNSLNLEKYKKVKLIHRHNNSLAEVGAINISKLPSGTYSLIISISDTVSKLKYEKIKKIYVYNPHIIDTTNTKLMEKDVMSSEYALYDEKELDEYFEKMKYITTNEEKKQWKIITDLNAKKEFIFKFWEKSDPDILTTQNEAKMEYFKRIDFATSNFSNILKKGWKTDRGRIYIQHGKPSEVERYPNQVNTKPYEIWKYEYIENGVIFVFADYSGFSDYRLIHSTLIGELQDDNWFEKVYIK